MNQEIAPPDIAAPAANYAHAVLTMAPATMLHTSGVVPVRPDGEVPAGLREQVEAVWSNISAMLTAAAMNFGDIISVTTYVVEGEDLQEVMAARDRALGGHRAASTLLVVPRLARPEWRLEIAVIAAR